MRFHHVGQSGDSKIPNPPKLSTVTLPISSGVYSCGIVACQPPESWLLTNGDSYARTCSQAGPCGHIEYKPDIRHQIIDGDNLTKQDPWALTGPRVSCALLAGCETVHGQTDLTQTVSGSRSHTLRSGIGDSSQPAKHKRLRAHGMVLTRGVIALRRIRFESVASTNSCVLRSAAAWKDTPVIRRLGQQPTRMLQRKPRLTLGWSVCESYCVLAELVHMAERAKWSEDLSRLVIVGAGIKPGPHYAKHKFMTANTGIEPNRDTGLIRVTFPDLACSANRNLGKLHRQGGHQKAPCTQGSPKAMGAESIVAAHLRLKIGALGPTMSAHQGNCYTIQAPSGLRA